MLQTQSITIGCHILSNQIHQMHSIYTKIKYLNWRNAFQNQMKHECNSSNNEYILCQNQKAEETINVLKTKFINQ